MQVSDSYSENWQSMQVSGSYSENWLSLQVTDSYSENVMSIQVNEGMCYLYFRDCGSTLLSLQYFLCSVLIS